MTIAPVNTKDHFTSDTLYDALSVMEWMRTPPGVFIASSTGAARPSTTSSTFVSVLITAPGLTAGRYRFRFASRTSSANVRFSFAIDGVQWTDDGNTSGDGFGAPIGSIYQFSRIVDIAFDNTYTVALLWRSTSGTVELDTAGLLQFSLVKIGEDTGMPTTTWTDIQSVYDPGDQITADLWNIMINNMMFLMNPPQALYAPATNASNITTTSSTFVLLTGFSVSITTQGNPVEVHFGAKLQGTTARVDILIDNIPRSNDNDGLGASVANGCIDITRTVTLDPGPHTIQVWWRSTSGTITCYPASAPELYVREVGGTVQ